MLCIDYSSEFGEAATPRTMAEGVGFEPTIPVSRDNRLAGGRTKPLCDPSHYLPLKPNEQTKRNARGYHRPCIRIINYPAPSSLRGYYNAMTNTRQTLEEIYHGGSVSTVPRLFFKSLNLLHPFPDSKPDEVSTRFRPFSLAR